VDNAVHLVVTGAFVMISTILLLFSALFMCLAAWSAVKANDSLLAARLLTRELRSRVEDMDVETTRNTANIKRLTSSVGGLSRGPNRIQDVTLPNGLPDPKIDPEAWRAAVRSRNNRKETH